MVRRKTTGVEQSSTPCPSQLLLWKWLVVHEQKEIVGAVDLSPVGEAGGDVFLIGVEIFPGHKGRGYARRAVECLIDWARRTHEVREIQGWCHPDNKASSGLMKKIGMAVTDNRHSAYFPCLQPPCDADMEEFSIKVF